MTTALGVWRKGWVQAALLVLTLLLAVVLLWWRGPDWNVVYQRKVEELESLLVDTDNRDAAMEAIRWLIDSITVTIGTQKRKLTIP